MASIRMVEEPYRLTFASAHAHLVHLHALRDSGEPIAKPMLFAAYDERVLAGHAWHPYRSQADDLAGWLKRLREDLKAVNKEIGA